MSEGSPKDVWSKEVGGGIEMLAVDEQNIGAGERCMPCALCLNV